LSQRTSDHRKRFIRLWVRATPLPMAFIACFMLDRLGFITLDLDVGCELAPGKEIKDLAIEPRIRIGFLCRGAAGCRNGTSRHGHSRSSRQSSHRHAADAVTRATDA